MPGAVQESQPDEAAEYIMGHRSWAAALQCEPLATAMNACWSVDDTSIVSSNRCHQATSKTCCHFGPQQYATASEL